MPIFYISVQFSSVAQSCLTLCDPTNHSTPGFPVHHQLLGTMLNNSGKNGHPCLVPDLRGNAFSFSPLRIMFVIGLSYMAFTMLRYVPSMPIFWRVLIINGYWILSKAFFASIESKIPSDISQGGHSRPNAFSAVIRLLKSCIQLKCRVLTKSTKCYTMDL